MGDISETCAVEVYPAATLHALDIETSGYKKGESAKTNRLRIIENLKKFYETNILNSQIYQVANNPDSLDAVICVLAGADFLTEKCIPIPDSLRGVAYKEGWIWVRKK